MELQISHSICSKVPQESILQGEEGRGRENTEDTLRVEEDKDRRSGGVPGPCTYAAGDTAKGIDIKLHGVLEGKKQPDDLREVPGAKV